MFVQMLPWRSGSAVYFNTGSPLYGDSGDKREITTSDLRQVSASARRFLCPCIGVLGS